MFCTYTHYLTRVCVCENRFPSSSVFCVAQGDPLSRTTSLFLFLCCSELTAQAWVNLDRAAKVIEVKHLHHKTTQSGLTHKIKILRLCLFVNQNFSAWCCVGQKLMWWRYTICPGGGTVNQVKPQTRGWESEQTGPWIQTEKTTSAYSINMVKRKKRK